jgi:stage II sporulation protein R
MKKLFPILLLVLVVFSFISCTKSNNADIVNKNLFRLHVIANSDSAEDQNVKLKVRNAVIAYFEEKEKDIKNIQEFKNLLIQNKDALLEVINNTLKEYNMNYKGTFSIGVYDFPEKEYYGTVVPAGKYEALRVILGNGEGKNWWCVLFPPLCFVDVEYEEIEGQAMELEDIDDIQVRSKLLEWLEKIK